MPRCEHNPTCVIGDFWTCDRKGCPNGPKEQPEKAPRRHERADTEPGLGDWIDFDVDLASHPARTMTVVHGLRHIADAEWHSGIWFVTAAPGYQIRHPADQKPTEMLWTIPMKLSLGYRRKDT